MDYVFDVMVDEPIIIDGTTVIRVTRIQAESQVKFGIAGPLEVWREEIPVEEYTSTETTRELASLYR